MGIVELIDRVRKEDRLTLTEAESKMLLRLYDVPVVEEAVAADWEEALAAAHALGYPVVLKGLGARLTHKTERGLVAVNLRSDEELCQAYDRIKAAAGNDWQGCLVQPLVKGKREFVAGLVRDPQFGPSVMFGLGGILTEALGDVVFRIAPLNEAQARAMVGEIKASRLLGPFRGEAAADEEELVQTLLGLSRLAMEHPEIREVDINPLIVGPDGRVKAVDALVVLDDGVAPAYHSLDMEGIAARVQTIREALDKMTSAQSVAVIGATKPRDFGFPGMYGCMRQFGFPGRLYPVNPNIDEIDGVKAYPNMAALPEKVDLVIVSVPAPLVPTALRDCAASGNRNIHIFTSGFKESGDEEGIRLQEEMERIAITHNLHVIGPNCMGLYVPKSRLLTWTAASGESGPVAFISQSGGNAQDFTNYTTSRYRIAFSKTFSFGNALTLDSTDFLDYLARDRETEIIAMYLEGVKDGRRLLDLTTEVNRGKPVIIYKGGLTESGARAVSSHTGSLAGGEKIWQAFFRQSGATAVDSLEEMADAVQAFHHLKTTSGPRTTVLGIGGGIGVSVADSCARAGLSLPALSPGLIKDLRTFIPPAGTMIRNPIDAVVAFINLPVMGEVLHLLARSGEIDNFIVSLPLDWLFDKGDGGSYIRTVATYLAEEARRHTSGMPLVVVWRQYQPSPAIRKWATVVEDILLSAGVPVYEGLPRAVSALAKLAAYSAFRKANP